MLENLEVLFQEKYNKYSVFFTITLKTILVSWFKLLVHLKNGFKDSLQVFLRLHFLVFVQQVTSPRIQVMPSFSGI